MLLRQSVILDCPTQSAVNQPHILEAGITAAFTQAKEVSTNLVVRVFIKRYSF